MTLEVTPRCCGSLAMDASVLVVGEHGRIEAPSTVFLIEGDRTVLVDTSFGDPGRMAEIHPGFRCHREPGQGLRAVLDDEGYAPADVDAVVLTHLDWDHCYNLELFGDDTEVYVSRSELAYAIAPYPMHAVRYEAKSLGLEPPWLSVDLEPIEGETEICEGVTVFATPGHTVGHVSVAVETGDGTTVIAADAIPTFENLAGTDHAPFRRGLAVNDFDWWESAGTVVERGDTVLPGHEWEILDADPAGTV